VALERRGRSTYYYRSVRQGKKVKRKYIAAGEDAELAAALQDHRRVIQQVTRELIEAHGTAWDDAFQALALLRTITGVLFKAVLLSKDFHRDRQGNGGGVRNEKYSRYSIPDVQEIVRRAETGDENALPELRTILDDCSEIWREASSLEDQTRETWIRLMVGKDLFRRETIERRVAAMRSEMTGPDSSALERLLVDQILCSWLAMSYANAMCALHQTKPDALVRLLWKQRNAAEKHIQAAIKQLLMMRELSLSPTNPGTIKLPTVLTESPMTPTDDGDENRNPKDDDPLLQAGKARAATS
jgi:hypothetical protein